MFRLKDISVVIPTYNRVDDLKETLNSIIPFAKKLNIIIVVDQIKDSPSKDLIENMKIKNLRRVYSSPPAITIARNVGISKVKSKLICFLDDDITLDTDYFNKILDVFNNHPEAKGVSAYYNNGIVLSGLIKIENLFKRLFFLTYFDTKERARVLSVYGNTYPYNPKNILISQWLTGFNMVYKKEVFKEQLFDTNMLSYSLAEDFDFSYRLYKKYNNGLFITPFAKIIHRVSKVERYSTQKISYMNQINHFYLNFKNFNNNFKEKIIFVWSIFGISILRIFKFIFTLRKIEYLKLKFYFKSLFYCFFNLKKIKQGKLMDFEKEIN